MLNIQLILHNLRSAHNVGAIFRTAEGAGVKKIYLTGYTPAPSDQFDRPNKAIAKTALGAEKSVAWEKREDIFKLLNELRATSPPAGEADCQLLALEQSENSVDYKKIKLIGDTALILGNEVGGIAPEI